MIENELEKGFEDLSGVRALAAAIRMGQGQQFNALGLYSLHEQKWGVWRPYLIQDSELLDLCEGYRTLVRDFRVAALCLKASEIMEREKQVEEQMSSMAKEIVAALEKRGW